MAAPVPVPRKKFSPEDRLAERIKEGYRSADRPAKPLPKLDQMWLVSRHSPIRKS